MNQLSLLIDACKYLYLDSITEPNEGGLRLVVKEAKAGGTPREEMLAAGMIPEVREILSQSSAIEHGPGCKVFEIYWPNYIAYAVENESYALDHPDDIKSRGRLFVEYSKSAYLEYLSKASFASPDYPGAYKHWAVLCLDHIVNVAAIAAPRISANED
jgi:hypothetical protein